MRLRVIGFAVIIAAMLLASTCRAPAVNDGIRVTPDEAGNFRFTDDFKTPSFLSDAFTDNLGLEQWQAGQITNSGPSSGRAITYRFYSDRVVKDLRVAVDQAAQSQLGGVNNLLLSANGLDWVSVANSGAQKGDVVGLQKDPLTVTGEQAAKFTGRTEVWVRVVMSNGSGLKTNTSNTIYKVQVDLTLGGRPADNDPQAALRASWGKLRQKVGWKGIDLSGSDPVEMRAPHYYEDSDGWLRLAGTNPDLAADESEGFPVHKEYMGWSVPGSYTKAPRFPTPFKFPLSLAVFVKTGANAPAMAAVTIRSRQSSSRKLSVLWDGKPVGVFDAASFFEQDRTLFCSIPPSRMAGVHELRILGADRGRTLVRQVSIAGRDVSWAKKPPLPGGGKLDVLSAYYLPDPEPPADSAEMQGEFQKGLYREFGGVRVVVRNTGRVPARIGSVLLNGKPVEDSYVDFARDAWHARGVVWYRVRPRLIQPGQCGQVYLRFRKRPTGDRALVALNLDNGRQVTVGIAYKDPGLAIDYVTTGKDPSTLYVYARRSAGANVGSVASLSLDGVALKNAKIYGSDFPGGVALVVAKLPRALRTGDYHVAGVTATSAKQVAAQFRVLPFVFTRTSINIPPDMCKQMHMNHAMWNQLPLETCEQYGITTTSLQCANGANPFDTHKMVAYVGAPDEIDAFDNVGGGYEGGLGYNARLMQHGGWQEIVERYAPWSCTWLNIDSTSRPMNWAVYGQFADVTGFDPYAVTVYGANQAFVRESLSYVRKCSMPGRLFPCLEAYGWPQRWEAGYAEGVGGYGRGPVPAEYRQNVVQAIGCGGKALTSWVYSGGVNGWQDYPKSKAEIAGTNALVEHIQDELLLGTPIDIAASDAGTVLTGSVGNEKAPKERVWVGALLCGPDTIVIAAANHIPANRPKAPKITPATNVTITVRMPKFLPQAKVFEATDTGLVPVSSTNADGKLLLKVDSIESGRVFVLRRQ